MRKYDWGWKFELGGTFLWWFDSEKVGDDGCKKESLWENAKERREYESDEVVQASNLAKHHKNVVNNSLLDGYFLAKMKHELETTVWRPEFFRMVSNVEEVDFFLLTQSHEIYVAILELSPDFIHQECFWVLLV